MALSSAMYAAVTGLSALGTGMQTISNNIANVNTVGFKAMRTNYEDLISQNYYSGGKVNQRGTGVKVSSIQSMFTQGAFMSSAQDTDMAITGEGFFAVRNAVTGGINYTRAGVFTLNKDGYMEGPAGNSLQGWQLSLPKPGLDAVKIGAPTDIKVTVLNAPPAATSQIKVVTNLDADADPAYQYKEHQLAFDYADPAAQAAAQRARSAAIFDIWNEFCQPVSESSAVRMAVSQRSLAGGLWVPAGAIGTAYSAKVFFTQHVVFASIGITDAAATSADVVASAVVSVIRTSSGSYYETAAIPAPPGLTANNVPYAQLSAVTSSGTYTAPAVAFSASTVSAAATALPINIPLADGVATWPSGAPITSGDTVSAVIWFTSAVTFTNPKTSLPETSSVNYSAKVYFKVNSSATYAVTSRADLETALRDPAVVIGAPFTGTLTNVRLTYDYPGYVLKTGVIPTVNMAGATATAYVGYGPVGTSLSTALYNSARVDFTPTASEIYDRNFLETYLSYALGGLSNSAVSWLQEQIRLDPVAALNHLTVVDDSGLDWPPLPASRLIETAPGSGQWLFKIGRNEISQFNVTAEERTMLDAVSRGETVYATTYAEVFKARAGIIEAYLPEWKLEGLGFAAAWDARDLDGDGRYIDSTGMMVEGVTIYDSLGSEHQVMVYYQKSPHMDNVWDYIITCDPLEDARKDSNNKLLLSDTARFSGLIQKGKITFTGDGTDRHGGIIKDIEAQNLDLSQCKMASHDAPERRSASTYTMLDAVIGGYYTGSPRIDPVTGQLAVADRTYQIFWGGVDGKKFQTADQKWQSAFTVYVNYLETIGDARLTGLTKVAPEDRLTNSSATWQEVFAADWAANSATLFAAAPATRAEIRALLPYAAYGASATLGTPYGAQRPNEDDLDPATSGRNALYWSGNVNGDPPTSGFTWVDSDGNRGLVNLADKNYRGPYQFGSGLTITFDAKDLPLRFGLPGQDGLNVTAHSEQLAWTNLAPNAQGFYDFDLAFVTSASMALHPPYPDGLPTITQHVAFDMGAKNPNGLAPRWDVDKDMSTTQYAASNATLFRGQDGHAAGSLQRLSIGEDGVVTGVYTNGFQMALYQIGLVRFLNPWGLSKLGDNLFAETRYSGAGAMNEPGNAGTGTILANFLEQSNVDVAEEIVNMILTQRGFQANSKTVTTTDTMLAEVIEMKR